jgi:hypothetical protein
MADTARRIDIGFQGGQVLPARVKQDDYDKLRKSLEGSPPDGWHVLDTQDSQVALDLSQVVYLRVDTEEQRVGF